MSRFLMSLDGQEQSLDTLEQLRGYWQEVCQRPFAEIWLHSPTGQMLAVLVNGDRAWLMFLRAEGDSGFSSRNPAYPGPDQATLEFRLSNGQVDAYPAS